MNNTNLMLLWDPVKGDEIKNDKVLIESSEFVKNTNTNMYNTTEIFIADTSKEINQNIDKFVVKERRKIRRNKRLGWRSL